jgi:quercetin dioxygenase-like cupin family protein
MDRLSQNERIYGTFNLDDVISELPPDPESEARHRAETLIKTGTLRVVLVTILSGGRLHDHSAPGPITIHVLRGAVNVTVEGEQQVLGSGELISLAPGVEHAVEGVEDGAFLLTIAHLSRIPDEGGDI